MSHDNPFTRHVIADMDKKLEARKPIEQIKDDIAELKSEMIHIKNYLRKLEIREQLKEEEESRLASKWKNLSDEKKEEAKAAARVREESDKAGTYGAALGNMQKLIVDAYIKNMMDILQIDQRL